MTSLPSKYRPKMPSEDLPTPTYANWGANELAPRPPSSHSSVSTPGELGRMRCTGGDLDRPTMGKPCRVPASTIQLFQTPGATRGVQVWDLRMSPRFVVDCLQQGMHSWSTQTKRLTSVALSEYVPFKIPTPLFKGAHCKWRMNMICQWRVPRKGKGELS